MKNFFILLGFLLGCASARGQSFNVDLDTSAPPQGGGGVPSNGFGAAANQPGHWNSVYVIGHADQLYGLDGTLTSVSLSIASSNQGISGGAFANQSNTGDFAKLLNDAANIDNIWRSWTFHGLTNGTYNVVTYSVSPFPQSVTSTISINGGAQATTSGVMPGNQFVSGVTHVTQSSAVTNGTLTILVSKPLGAETVFCNGFQITAVVPEPNSICIVVLALSGYLCRRRAKP